MTGSAHKDVNRDSLTADQLADIAAWTAKQEATRRAYREQPLAVTLRIWRCEA